MNVAEKMRFSVRELSPNIGAEIRASNEVLLSGEFAGQIRAQLESRGVLVFPQVHFTDDEQIAFTHTLGTFAKEIQGDDVFKVSLDKRHNATADYLRGAFYWHIDGTMSPMPILASILCSKVLSPTGGNTEFCNTYAAYDALSDEDKAMLDGVMAVHTLTASQVFLEPEPSLARFREWRSFGTNELPLVWKHQSGRKSLVIGNTIHHIKDMNPLDGQELLIRLRDWATQPQFTYSHEWSVGDMVIWDNTGTMHRATEYPLDCDRMLHRTKLAGEEPFA